MKVYHKFYSFNIYSSFSPDIFMKAVNVPFSICQIKIFNNPSHSLSMYDIFNGENSKLSTLTISMFFLPLVKIK